VDASAGPRPLLSTSINDQKNKKKGQGAQRVEPIRKKKILIVLLALRVGCKKGTTLNKSGFPTWEGKKMSPAQITRNGISLG